MHSNSAPRRRHDAQIKAKVLAACNEPGASIAAVALAHGLNANLVRKWRHGRGLKRTGIAVSSSVLPAAPVVSPAPAAAPPLLMAEARFLPIEMSEPVAASTTGSAGRVDTTARGEATIDIELRRGLASLAVRWPASAAGDCAAWLREVTAGLVK
jgi:transposase